MRQLYLEGPRSAEASLFAQIRPSTRPSDPPLKSSVRRQRQKLWRDSPHQPQDAEVPTRSRPRLTPPSPSEHPTVCDQSPQAGCRSGPRLSRPSCLFCTKPHQLSCAVQRRSHRDALDLVIQQRLALQHRLDLCWISIAPGVIFELHAIPLLPPRDALVLLRPDGGLGSRPFRAEGRGRKAEVLGFLEVALVLAGGEEVSWRRRRGGDGLTSAQL